jgi:hypothetical protein
MPLYAFVIIGLQLIKTFGGAGRTNARSDRVVLELFGYFFFQEKK